jgi:hypothetical protein
VKEQGQGRSDQKPTSQNNAYLKEQGKPSPGFTAPNPEQAPHGGGIKSPERQPLPGVWDILERRVKLWAPALGQPLMSKEEYVGEACGVKLLKEEIEKKGTAREKLIFALFELDKRTFRPDRPGTDILNLLGTDLRSIFLKELQQFRSRVEPMADEELAKEVRQLEQLYEAYK